MSAYRLIPRVTPQMKNGLDHLINHLKISSKLDAGGVDRGRGWGVLNKGEAEGNRRETGRGNCG